MGRLDRIVEFLVEFPFVLLEVVLIKLNMNVLQTKFGI